MVAHDAELITDDLKLRRVVSVLTPGQGSFVFDFDGLIIDSEWPYYATISALYREHGLELSEREWVKTIGTNDGHKWADDLVTRAGLSELPHDVVESIRATKNNATFAEPLRDGIMELIAVLEEREISRHVASSSSREWVESNLERLGIRKRFHSVSTRTDVGVAKPAPAVYFHAVEQSRNTPDRVVAFEDSFTGALAAKRAGLKCIWYPNRLTRLLRSPTAECEVANGHQVAEAILCSD